MTSIRPSDRSQERQRRRRFIVIAVVTLAALLLLLLFRCEPEIRGAFDGTGRANLDDRSYRIDGDLTQPISPGRTARLNLTMTNPHQEPMTVSDLEIAVVQVSAPQADQAYPCSIADFLIEQPGTDLQATVPGRTSRSLSDLGVEPDRWPRVGMVDRTVNQDGCKNAVVELAYSGSGRVEN